MRAESSISVRANAANASRRRQTSISGPNPWSHRRRRSMRMTKTQFQSKPPRLGTPFVSMQGLRIPVFVFGMSLGLFLAITYALCVGFAQIGRASGRERVGQYV